MEEEEAEEGEEEENEERRITGGPCLPGPALGGYSCASWKSASPQQRRPATITVVLLRHVPCCAGVPAGTFGRNSHMDVQVSGPADQGALAG